MTDPSGSPRFGLLPADDGLRQRSCNLRARNLRTPTRRAPTRRRLRGFETRGAKPATQDPPFAVPSRSQSLVAPADDPSAEAHSDERRNFDGILDSLGELGLRFPDDLVASYLLALQAKRFVVLSGISGTGKTQLALAVARAFRPSGASDDAESSEPELDPEVRRIRVQPYMKKHRLINRRLVVPAAMVERLTDGGPTRVEVHR